MEQYPQTYTLKEFAVEYKQRNADTVIHNPLPLSMNILAIRVLMRDTKKPQTYAQWMTEFHKMEAIMIERANQAVLDPKTLEYVTPVFPFPCIRCGAMVQEDRLYYCAQCDLRLY